LKPEAVGIKTIEKRGRDPEAEGNDSLVPPDPWPPGPS